LVTFGLKPLRFAEVALADWVLLADPHPAASARATMGIAMRARYVMAVTLRSADEHPMNEFFISRS
jgi:hypothetical protein